MPGAGSSVSWDAVQPSQISSGQTDVPPERARVSVGWVGAVMSELGSVVAVTELDSGDMLPPPSTARTVNVCVLPGVRCRTHIFWLEQCRPGRQVLKTFGVGW